MDGRWLEEDGGEEVFLRVNSFRALTSYLARYFRLDSNYSRTASIALPTRGSSLEHFSTLSSLAARGVNSFTMVS